MEKQASTPGPWTADQWERGGMWSYSIRPHRPEDGGMTGFQLAFIEGGGPASSYRTMGGSPEANARLMAASPDMLTALKQAEKYLASRVVGTGGEGERVVLPAIRAAIQKAVQGD